MCFLLLFELLLSFFHLQQWKNRIVLKENHTKQSMNNEKKKKQYTERENERDDILLQFLTSQMIWFIYFRAMHNGSRSIQNNQNIHTEIQSKSIQCNRFELMISTMQTTMYCAHTFRECDHLPFDTYSNLCRNFAFCHSISSLFLQWWSDYAHLHRCKLLSARSFAFSSRTIRILNSINSLRSKSSEAKQVHKYHHCKIW